MSWRTRLSLLRLLFYGGVAGFGLLVHWASLLEGRLPAEVIDLVRRNSEAYLLMILVALDVELISAGPPGTGRARRSAWLAVLAVAWVATYFLGQTLGLPQAIITLNEPLMAAVIISLYLPWSREKASPWEPIRGRQLAYYAVAVALVVLGELPLAGWEGSPAMVAIVDNAETIAAAILVSLYFDLVGRWPQTAPWTTSRWRIAWYPLLALTPVAYTLLNPVGRDLTLAEGLGESTVAWLQRTTEAFIAALGISLYFDLRAWALRQRPASRRVEGLRTG